MVPFFNRGGFTMKGAMVAVAVLAVGCCTLPTFAQQQDLQEVMNATNALGAKENELLGKKDAIVWKLQNLMVNLGRIRSTVMAPARANS